MFITDCYGNITVSYIQEGFGNVLATSGSLTTNNYHLTTKEIDPDTGLYYFYARWYDPMIGRFITQEPSGIDGPNLYHYGFNNPINGFDPDGSQYLVADDPDSFGAIFWDNIYRDYQGILGPGSERKPGESYSCCLSRCIEKNRSSSICGLALTGNAIVNKIWGTYPRGGFTGYPKGSPSTWIHRIAMGTKYDQLAKGIGRTLSVLTVGVGFYDLGTITRCAVECK